MSFDTQVVCTRCKANNRIPALKNPLAAKCGACHEKLFVGEPAQLEGVGLDAQLKGDLPVLVDFWAPWCGPCRTMGPEYKRAAATLEPHVRLVKLNTQANSHVAARYRIQAIPTMVLFRNGVEIARQSGAMVADGIVRWTRSKLS